jgi:hypothetical protein
MVLRVLPADRPEFDIRDGPKYAATMAATSRTSGLPTPTESKSLLKEHEVALIILVCVFVLFAAVLSLICYARRRAVERTEEAESALKSGVSLPGGESESIHISTSRSIYT